MSKSQQGFTIVELMIATMIFSAIILIASSTVVRFTNNFQKGLVEASTQNVARSIVDTVSQALQFGGGYAFISTPGQYCIGSTKYTYTIGRQLGSTTPPNALLQRLDTGNNCSGPGAGGQELLATNMRVVKFDIAPITGTKLYAVDVMIAYGDDDLLCSSAIANSCDSTAASLNIMTLTKPQMDGLECKSVTGSQFCAVRELSTTVETRL